MTINRARYGVGLVAGLAAGFFGSVQDVHAGISFDPALTWRTVRSAHFAVHYHDGEEALARTTLAIAERVHTRLSGDLHWTPQEPTDVVLSDGSDLSNGYAQVIPTDRMTLLVTPPDSIDGLEDHDGWLETVITHEYTHILHLDKAAGAPYALRYVFGRNFLLFPNTFEPSWLIEGIATYAETDTGRGYGRGQSAYFNMLMRTELQHGLKPLAQVNQSIATWPGGITPYLYGVQFYNFIDATQGEKKIPQWVEGYSDNLLPFFINTNSAQVLGKSLKRLWPEFDSYLQTKYAQQNADLEKSGVRQGVRLTQHGYRTGSARVLPDGTLFYLVNDGGSEPGLMMWSPGAAAPRRLVDVQAPARFDVHARAGVLLAQPERFHNADLFYDLYRADLRSGRLQRLTRGGRYHYASWSPDGQRILAVHQGLAKSELRLLTDQGEPLETLWRGEPQVVVADLQWSPDGASAVAAVWRPASHWNIEVFSLAQRRWTPLTHDQAIEAQPRFSADASAVLFTSDHGGVYNLRRLVLASGAITTLSNVPGGAFYPSQATVGGPIYYTGAGPDGFDIYRLDRIQETPLTTHPDRSPDVAQDTSIATESMASESYSPYSSLRPRWWFPHLALDSSRTEIGVITSASDALRRHNYYADLAYDFQNDQPVGELDYVYDRWFPLLKLRVARSNSIYNDAGGATARVRASDTYQAEVVFPLLTYRHRLALNTAVYQVRDHDVWTEAGVSPAADSSDNVAGLAVLWDSTRYYPFSISRTNGRHIQLVAENSDVLGGSDYTGSVYTLDWREFLALGGRHVLALRVAGGWGTESPRPYVLGGSFSAVTGLPLVDALNFYTPFDQRDFALRGYTRGTPELVGRRMALTSAEWRFPLGRVERGIMAPPLALQQLYGSVFVDSGAAWNDGDRPDAFATGAGVEAYADTFIFYNVPLSLRLGYAHGYNAGGDDQVYLQVGSSF
jgi:hypothetical protein